MNRYILLHRLMGPAILLLLGTVALLHQAHLVRWTIFVPLLLILIGVIKLAERAALANDPNPPAPYPGVPYQGQPYPGQPYAGQPYAGQPYQGATYPETVGGVPTTTTSVPTHDFGNDPEGGK